ncbi:MAG: dihydrolipoamide acetyltransferase family protein [bacterium]
MAQAQQVLMPKFGQMVEESTIITWRKKEGDKIATGDILFEIETDKANMEVESFLDGTLLKVLVKEGQTVAVQTPVAFVGSPGDSIPDVKVQVLTPGEKKQPAESTARAATPAHSVADTSLILPASAPAPQVPLALVAPPGKLLISPRASKLAREKVIDPVTIKGTGPRGRIVERDVVGHLEKSGYNSLRITPAALKLAAKEGIDILSARPQSPGGRIEIADVERAMAELPRQMSKMRQTIAQRLTQSFTTTPHIYVTVEADMTDLMVFRASLKEKGLSYTVTDFIMKAVVDSLVEFPDVNSSTDGRAVRWHSNVNLGLAVSVDKGLVVPVVRSAQNLSLAELHDRAAELAARARDGKLMPDEMTGGTFTISNMGMMNVENFSAIINPGESAILAVASAARKPAVKGDQVVVRSMMKMTVSADHRIVDGALAAQFVNSIKTKLEDVESWNTLI